MFLSALPFSPVCFPRPLGQRFHGWSFNDSKKTRAWLCVEQNLDMSICKRLYPGIYIHVYMHIHVNANNVIYVCMYVRMYVHVCTCLCESIRLQSAWVNMPWLSEVMQSLLKQLQPEIGTAAGAFRLCRWRLSLVVRAIRVQSFAMPFCTEASK